MVVNTSFYLEAQGMIRNISGRGEGNGPCIAVHDGSQLLLTWKDYLQSSDPDTHLYFSFEGILEAHIVVSPVVNAFRVTTAGESAATPNICGLFLVRVGQNLIDPQCSEYDDWQNHDSTMNEGLQNLVMASMDALGDWFFWPWKVVGPAQYGVAEAPGWSC
ncbi:hypothetical protein CVT26_001398 [Gymnopilus dilepis]|uniref:Uncharacterized protein n=1 Tax=Gymnopilus dilepis TaxID=231916 RepID=A0A409W7J6_9AGAR|nr:hypothetical protein CVT26_001398 [Gymnopilus dilepis]